MVWFLPILSALAWIGIDFGISYVTSSDVAVDYVYGLDFQQFIGGYWLPTLAVFAMIIAGMWVANPHPRSYRR